MLYGLVIGGGGVCVCVCAHVCLFVLEGGKRINIPRSATGYSQHRSRIDDKIPHLVHPE